MANTDYSNPTLYPYGRYGINVPGIELPDGRWREMTPAERSVKGLPAATPTSGNVPRTMDAAGTPAGPVVGSGAPYASTVKETPVETEAQAFERLRSQRQAQIDALDAFYAQKTSQEREAGDVRAAQTRGINVRSGLMGSDFASSAAAETERGTKKNIDFINAEKQLKIQEIFGEINKAATEAAKFSLTQNRADIALNEEARVKNYNTARQRVADLAKLDVNLTALKQTPEYNTLLGASGMTPELFDVYYNSNLTDANRINFQGDHVIKGADGNAYLVQYGIDPASGQQKSRQVNLGVSYEQWSPSALKPIEAGGYIFAFDERTGTAKRIGGYGPAPTQSQQEDAATRNLISEFTPKIDKLVDPTTGYIPFEQYRSLRNEFSSGSGGSASSFDSQYANYLSPQDRYKQDIGTTPQGAADQGFLPPDYVSDIKKFVDVNKIAPGTWTRENVIAELKAKNGVDKSGNPIPLTPAAQAAIDQYFPEGDSGFDKLWNWVMGKQ